MKPLLVICPGLMKSGTTSLYHHFYTSYYLHFGHGKEHYYLNTVYRNDRSCEHEFKKNFLSEKFFTFRENHQFKSFEPYYKERILENYKNYFLEISEYYVSQKKMFYGVADFSQSYATLSLDDVKHFKDYISEYFDVRIIMMLRDPVKRLYSYCNMVAGKDKAKEYFYHILTDKLEYNYYSNLYFDFTSKWGFDFWGANHSKLFFYEKIFSNHDTQEFEKMNTFLGLPQHLINQQTYCIRGDYQNNLTEEDILFAKEKLRREYAHIHMIMGYLPDTWEYASDWNVDCFRYSNLNANYNISPTEHYQ